MGAFLDGIDFTAAPLLEQAIIDHQSELASGKREWHVEHMKTLAGYGKELFGPEIELKWITNESLTEALNWFLAGKGEPV